MGAGKDRAQGRTRKLEKEKKTRHIVVQAPCLRECWKKHAQHHRAGAGEPKTYAQNKARHRRTGRGFSNGGDSGHHTRQGLLPNYKLAL